MRSRGTAVVFAYHDVGCMGVRTLVRMGVELPLVYTHEDEPGENRWFGSVRRTCEDLGVACRTADPHDPAEIDRIRAAAPDAIFSVYYRDMLRDSVLSLAKRAAVNLHGSYLPRYRGRAPVNWMILHGETRGGVTLHHMVRRPDAGDVVDQEAFDVGPDETAVDVYAKMLPAAERVLERSALGVLDGTAPRILQMESKATYHGRRRPEDGRIEWRWCAEDVRNLVRAVTKPYPGAFTFAGPTRIGIWRTAHPANPADISTNRQDSGARNRGFPVENTGGSPETVAGTVIVRDGVHVVCGDRRLLRLVSVEIDGREGDGLDFPNVLAHGVRLGGV